MADHQEYFEYLKKRSKLGLIYRRWWLYPKISSYLQGDTLDIGCGIGDMLRYRPEMTGVDVNPLTIDWLKSQGMKAHVMQPDLLPFEDNSFDSILMDNVLEHISSPAAILAEVRRVLRSHGKLVVGVPGLRGYASDPDHKIFYDKEKLGRCFISAEYRPVEFFYSPFKFRWFDKYLRQYCTFGVFEIK